MIGTQPQIEMLRHVMKDMVDHEVALKNTKIKFTFLRQISVMYEEIREEMGLRPSYRYKKRGKDLIFGPSPTDIESLVEEAEFHYLDDDDFHLRRLMRKTGLPQATLDVYDPDSGVTWEEAIVAVLMHQSSAGLSIP